jgi:hypothetical protein
MIDDEEEDVEKLLKRRISWKALLKGIVGFLLLGGAFVLITISQTSEGINTTYFLLGIMLMCLSSSVLVPIPTKKTELRHTISILKCESCGIERVRDYQDGDYVYKDTDLSCPNCEGRYKIHSVYSLKLKQKKSRKSK